VFSRPLSGVSHCMVAACGRGAGGRAGGWGGAEERIRDEGASTFRGRECSWGDRE
jgi:hypothetical protein